MKLANVFMAKEAWGRLSQLKMPPKTAYTLLKYVKLFDVEHSVLEQQRSKLIRDAAGVKEDENASLASGTPEHAAFWEKFSAVLDTDCELELIPLDFGQLLDTLGAEQGNALSVQDLSVLEPFFAKKE
jgi:hypothetical protein